jgi:hypothetical protein
MLGPKRGVLQKDRGRRGGRRVRMYGQSHDTYCKTHYFTIVKAWSRYESVFLVKIRSPKRRFRQRIGPRTITLCTMLHLEGVSVGSG